MGRILIIEDSKVDRLVLRRIVESMGESPDEAESAEEGIRMVNERDYDVILMDFQLPGKSGLEALSEIKAANPVLPVVFVTAFDEAELTIEAMRFGAYDYLTKPVDPDALKETVKDALSASARMKVRVELEPHEQVSGQKERIVGRSPAMSGLYKLIGQAAATDATVLITGDSGTGKELVARAIYQHSARADRQFLTVNCAPLPDTLLESELFGHERGAFTGAYHRHIGKFEQANEGTIFLDEVAEMGALTQAKILRVIQDKTFQRVGGDETLTCDVRIIAATNRDLRKDVENGRFRADLYYRLNVVTIHVPSLVERKEDIPELCDYFARQIASEVGKPIPYISAEVIDLFLDYDWPGNVRELRNVLARAIVTAPAPLILPEHVHFEAPKRVSDQASLFPLCPFGRHQIDNMPERVYSNVMSEVERRLILYALERCGGNQVQASKVLGVFRTMLRNRMERYGLLGDS